MTGAKHGAMRNYPCLTMGQQHCPCQKVEKRRFSCVLEKNFLCAKYLCETVALSCTAVGILSIVLRNIILAFNSAIFAMVIFLSA